MRGLKKISLTILLILTLGQNLTMGQSFVVQKHAIPTQLHMPLATQSIYPAIYPAQKYYRILDSLNNYRYFQKDATPNKNGNFFLLQPYVHSGYFASLNGEDNYGIVAGGGRLVYHHHSEKFYAEAKYVHYSSQWPSYQTSVYDTLPFLNGFGQYNQKHENAFSGNVFTGLLSYSPVSFINLQLGNDKVFLGEGYRSLYLSDNAPAYPFVKAEANVWKLKYAYMLSFMRGYERDEITGTHKKYSVMHFLHWQVTPKFALHVFESVLWRHADSAYNRGIDPNYLNPLIVFRPLEYGLGSSDNVLLGLGMSYTPWPNVHLYSQLLFDEFTFTEIKAGNGYWGNKNAFQAGVKSTRKIADMRLHLQAEYNQARPFTYSHFDALQVYSHRRQALAHPLGAGFREGVLSASIFLGRFEYKSELIAARYSSDTENENFGNNIFRSDRDRLYDYGYDFNSGIINKMLFIHPQVSYIIHPDWNMRVQTGIILRYHQSGDKVDNQHYIYLGLFTPFVLNHSAYAYP